MLKWSWDLAGFGVIWVAEKEKNEWGFGQWFSDSNEVNRGG